MPIDTSQVQIFTDAELLALFRKALAALATGQEYSMPDGRRLRRADLNAIRDTIDWLESKTADTETGGIALVRFGERV